MFPRTKIQAPKPRAASVARGALEDRLVESLGERRVCLLCAPAGYGKTTLLAHALARLPAGHAVAWIAADEGDDLPRLLECLLAALEPFDPPWRAAPESLPRRVDEGADEERAVAAELINALDATEVPHGVIAFDDLHRVDDPAVYRFLDRLAERLGPRWTLAIASRTEPAIALARLRASGDLAEYRQLHLQFSRDEARELAAASGLEAPLAGRIFDRTQGWPAALRIAVGAASGGAVEAALRSGERPMHDYLLAEVLDRQRPELADFLLRVSVLPDLDEARCAAVSGHGNAAALLDEIERLGLFVDVLDGPGRTLRLHDLFRDALQQRLQVRDPALLKALRTRAAETEPDPVRRMALLLDAGAAREAEAMVLEHLPAHIALSGPAGAERLVARFPAEVRDRSPALMLVRGLVAWVHWDFAGMLEHFARAEAGFTAAGDAPRALLARAYRAGALITCGRLDEAAAVLDSMRGRDLPEDARIVMLNALSWLHVDTGRTRSVAANLDAMLDALERADRPELWYQTTPAIRYPGLPGITRPLMRQAELLMRAAGDRPTTFRALGIMMHAWRATWRGDLAQALVLAERAREDAAWSGGAGAVRAHLLSHAAITHAMGGNAAEALAAARARLAGPTAAADSWSRYITLCFVMRIAAATDDVDALREAAREVEASLRRFEARGTPAKMPLHAPAMLQLAFAEGRAPEAIAGWRRLLDDEESIDVYGQAAETRVRLAAALARAGEVNAAAVELGPVFARAREDGGPGGALLARGPLHELARVRWGNALGTREQDELRSWTAPADPAKAESEGKLTARELEVLERIAAGDSNKLIARAMNLSLHTVKRHVANILGKLGVETRGQAAAWLARRGA